jgi:hypothetical protein
VVLQLVAYDVTNLQESTTDCKRTEKKLIASIGFKDQIEVSLPVENNTAGSGKNSVVSASSL